MRAKLFVFLISTPRSRPRLELSVSTFFFAFLSRCDSSRFRPRERLINRAIPSKRRVRDTRDTSCYAIRIAFCVFRSVFETPFLRKSHTYRRRRYDLFARQGGAFETGHANNASKSRDRNEPRIAILCNRSCTTSSTCAHT